MLGVGRSNRTQDAQLGIAAIAYWAAVTALLQRARSRWRKGAVRAAHEALATGKYKFVMRTDVRGHYANIHHTRLLEQVRTYVDDANVLDLVSQYCQRNTVHRGHYQRIEKGIPLGCSLSPLMGALYLDVLDKRLEKLPGIMFARLQDDVLILAETRWKLRRAVRVLNDTFAELSVEKHSDKTFIGRVERGFDFLGYHFALNDSEEVSESPNQTNKEISLTPAPSAIRRMTEKLSRLYEQRASKERVDQYMDHWIRWFLRGLDRLSVNTGNIQPYSNDTNQTKKLLSHQWIRSDDRAKCCC